MQPILILLGELPREAFLLDGLLVGLEKPGDGVRPFKITAKRYHVSDTRFAVVSALRTYRRGLTPLQVDVATPSGTEPVAQALASALAEDPEIVVISLDMANAFNSVHRAAMFAAVQSAPARLPMVLWAYGEDTRLHIVGAPEGTPPVMSQRGVRQGNPLAPLLFALTLQPVLEVLEQVDAACEEAPLVPYVDDKNTVGKLTPAAGAFRQLYEDDDGVRSKGLGLEPRLPKCGIYGGDKVLVAAQAAKVWTAHQVDGFNAVGTPLESAEYISNALGWRAATVEKLTLHTRFLLRATTHGACHADGASGGDAHASHVHCSMAGASGRARLAPQVG